MAKLIAQTAIEEEVERLHELLADLPDVVTVETILNGVNDPLDKAVSELRGLTFFDPSVVAELIGDASQGKQSGIFLGDSQVRSLKPSVVL